VVKVLIVVVVAVLATGCGGGGNGDREGYAADATSDCLEGEAGVRLDEPDDAEALGLDPGSAVQAELPRTSVYLAFARSETDAKNVQSAIRTASERYGVGATEEILYQKDNVVFSWDATPTDEEREKVESCLRS
jgi:hypothetical protein